MCRIHVFFSDLLKGGCQDKEAADVLDSNLVHVSRAEKGSHQNSKKREALPMPKLRSSRCEALDVDAQFCCSTHKRGLCQGS